MGLNAHLSKCKKLFAKVPPRTWTTWCLIMIVCIKPEEHRELPDTDSLGDPKKGCDIGVAIKGV